jgi:hypothetical protein
VRLETSRAGSIPNTVTAGSSPAVSQDYFERKIMKITKKWLEEKEACQSGKDWVIENYPNLEGVELVKRLMDKDLSWSNWIIVRIMNYKQYVSYAVFSAEQVIDIYEKKYPDDKRPRKAIEAAKKCIDNPSKENKAYADSSASAAASAASAASSAAASAASAAASAAYAAYADSSAAAASAASAAYARKEMQIKILHYGLSLLEAK